MRGGDSGVAPCRCGTIDSVTRRLAVALVTLFAWFAVAGVFTWVAHINTIECGIDPDRCEPGVALAANAGIAAQVVAFVVSATVLRRISRHRVLNVRDWLLAAATAVVVLVMAWSAARAVVESQF